MVQRYDEENAVDLDEPSVFKDAGRRPEAGGCTFGLFSFLILAFAVWLFHQSSISRYKEEIDQYLIAVQDWKDYRNEFTPTIKVVPYQCVDDLVLKEGCSMKTLNTTNVGGYVETKVRLAMGRAFRDANGDIITSPQNDHIQKLQYDEWYYNSTWLPGQNEIFPKLTKLDIAYSRRSLFLLIDEELHEFKNIQMLQRQHKMSTNAGQCNHIKSVGTISKCWEYEKLTKLSLQISKTDKNWKIDGILHTSHKSKVQEHRDYHQNISLSDYPLTIEVRSNKDPKVQFKQITNGREVMDEEPEKEQIAAIILLIIGSLTSIITIYKIYRHCVKYELKQFFKSRNYRKYVQEQEANMKEVEVTNDKKPKGMPKKTYEEEPYEERDVEMEDMGQGERKKPKKRRQRKTQLQAQFDEEE